MKSLFRDPSFVIFKATFRRGTLNTTMLTFPEKLAASVVHTIKMAISYFNGLTALTHMMVPVSICCLKKWLSNTNNVVEVGQEHNQSIHNDFVNFGVLTRETDQRYVAC